MVEYLVWIPIEEMIDKILAQNPVNTSSYHIEVIDCFVFKVPECVSVTRLYPFEGHKHKVSNCAPGVVEVLGHALSNLICSISLLCSPNLTLGSLSQLPMYCFNGALLLHNKYR